MYIQHMHMLMLCSFMVHYCAFQEMGVHLKALAATEQKACGDQVL